ncbi:MAG: DUF4430 domain-containing protein [Candidatus Asgardarchaeia archaeon]
MSESNKKVWIVAIVLLIWALGATSAAAYYYQQYTAIQTSYNNLVTGKMFVSIGIDYGNGTVEWYNNTIVPQNVTAFDVLLLVAEVNFTTSSWGVFVNAINGVENNVTMANHWWMYYVNGEMPMVAADRYILHANDIVLWVYEESTW